ncbi:UDP-3-O-(3-hydroxymyristoyl)glucosamine N-acyltransferase [Candidatus Sumerlaeota bacterium]|nr:UDP-3-O-(3-hydroxymyristoyl)glucosamine N-acyltransferase [Candidatus Sumerlaeota bacterium]
MREKKDITISLRTLAKELGGEIHNLPSGKDVEIKNIVPLSEAGQGDISFVTSGKFVRQATESNASGFLAPSGIIIENRPTLCLEQVWKGVLWLINYFYPEKLPEAGVNETAIVGKNVSLGKDVSIGPYTVIGDDAVIGDSALIEAQCYIGNGVRIGKNCRIFPRVVIMDNTIIGDNVIIHSGAVIGSDGYKYEVLDGVRTKIPQIGRVVIEDNVEIGANTCIDRATFTETRIGRATKIDNLVHIAHNVSIGSNCLIIAQVGIAGSSVIGNNCVLAGQVGIADNIRIGNNVQLGAKTGVHRNIPDNQQMLGIPAMPAKQFARVIAALQKLPETSRNLHSLRNRVNQLIEQQESGIE